MFSGVHAHAVTSASHAHVFKLAFVVLAHAVTFTLQALACTCELLVGFSTKAFLASTASSSRSNSSFVQKVKDALQ